jgi:hypothetical protein
MFYVARLYNHSNPSIIMDFNEEEHAKQYAELMTKAGKGTYIVLMPVPKEELK